MSPLRFASGVLSKDSNIVPEVFRDNTPLELPVTGVLREGHSIRNTHRVKPPPPNRDLGEGRVGVSERGETRTLNQRLKRPLLCH